MSFSNYEASFKNPNNRYVKFFCDNPASCWTLEDFNKQFPSHKSEKLFYRYLQVVKHHSKDIPAEVAEYLESAIIKKDIKRKHADIEIYGNHNVVNNKCIIINHGNTKRQRKNEEKEGKGAKDADTTDDEDAASMWRQFIVDCQKSTNLHKYSPKKNGVIKFGYDKNESHSYQDFDEVKSFLTSMLSASSVDGLEEKVEDTPLLANCRALCLKVKKLLRVTMKVFTKNPSISYSKAVFNDSFVFRFLDFAVSFVDPSLGASLVVGEEPLAAMTYTLQLTDLREKYNADGLVRFKAMDNVEVLVLETSGCYKSTNDRKIAFDNAKGMFALLSMLKCISDMYPYATIKTFKQLKVFFVQVSGCHVHLWSMKYHRKGVYDFVCEEKSSITEEVEEAEDMVLSSLRMAAVIKTCLEEAFELLKKLKEENQANRVIVEASSQLPLLSDLVCPKVFNLNYNKHSKSLEKRKNIGSAETQ